MRKMFVFATVAIIILAGCSKEEDATVPSRLPNELGISIQNVTTKGLTKSEITSFTDKSVNIFIEGVLTGKYTSRLTRYTLTKSNWEGPTVVSDKIILTQDEANVYGYYPVDATFDLATKTMACAVPKSQDFSATEATDYMYSTGADYDLSPAFTKAVVSSKTSNSNLAQLYFHHALSKVCFVINKSQSYPPQNTAGVLRKIKLVSGTSKFSTAGTLNVTTGAYTSTATDTTLTLTGTANLTEYADIVADSKLATPQAYGIFAPIADLSGINITLTIDGDIFTTSLATSSVSKWLPGNRYVYTATIASHVLTLNCAIVPWIVSVQDLGILK